jgi:hypothetical protein
MFTHKYLCFTHIWQTETCQYNASAAVAHIRDWDVLGEDNFDGLTGEEGMKTVLATHGPVTAFFVQTYANLNIQNINFTTRSHKQ